MFKIITRCASEVSAEGLPPACAIIEIDGRGVAQLAMLYRAARQAEAYGGDESVAWPCGGLSVRWQNGVEESDTVGMAFGSGMDGERLSWLVINPETETNLNGDGVSASDATGGAVVAVDPMGFRFRARGEQTDILYETVKVGWDDAPGLKDAIEKALRNPPATFPELDWNRIRPEAASLLPALPPETPAMPGKVSVLILESGDKRTAHVFQTGEQAKDAAYGYVVDHWNNRFDDEAPDDPSGLSVDEVLDAYFEGHEDDNFSIIEVKPSGFAKADGGPKAEAAPPPHVFVLMMRSGDAEKFVGKVGTTFDEAKAGAYEHAIDYWDRRADQEAPDDPSDLSVEEVMDAFYTGHETEDWDVHEREVEGIRSPQNSQPSTVFMLSVPKDGHQSIHSTREGAAAQALDNAMKNWAYRDDLNAPATLDGLSSDEILEAYYLDQGYRIAETPVLGTPNAPASLTAPVFHGTGGPDKAEPNLEEENLLGMMM